MASSSNFLRGRSRVQRGPEASHEQLPSKRFIGKDHRPEEFPRRARSVDQRSSGRKCTRPRIVAIRTVLDEILSHLNRRRIHARAKQAESNSVRDPGGSSPPVTKPITRAVILSSQQSWIRRKTNTDPYRRASAATIWARDARKMSGSSRYNSVQTSLAACTSAVLLAIELRAAGTQPRSAGDERSPSMVSSHSASSRASSPYKIRRGYED